MLARTVLIVSLAVAASFAHAADAPTTYYWESDRLAEVKRRLEAGEADAEVSTAVSQLRAQAETALAREPVSVVEKETPPASGDKHDYLSYSVYWWPDPEQPRGTPFIRRDGYTNYEQRAKGDRDRLKTTIEDIETLALAHYLLGDDGDDKYGDYARRLVRNWFLDPETRMNPHLQYAQAVVGREEGRSAGIIDSRAFVELLDALALLEHTGALPDEDVESLDEWFSEYLDWLLTSEHGRDERDAENNHGTWYLAQAVRVALHLGELETARELLEEARDDRLAAAIEADGSQPEELERTRSLHYSLFNLAAFAYLARMGESLGIDLWGHEDEGRGSMEQGLMFAAPYVLDQERWPHEQVHEYDLSPQTVQLFRMAAARYDEPLLRRVLQEAPRSQPDRNYAPLLFALPEK